jgi:hypothetical protein
VEGSGRGLFSDDSTTFFEVSQHFFLPETLFSGSNSINGLFLFTMETGFTLKFREPQVTWNAK